MQNYTDFFVQQNETTKVYLDNSLENWVEIKAEMSVGDYEKYESGLLQAEVEAGGNGTGITRQSRAAGSQTKMVMNAGNVSLMDINIVAWSFEGIRPQPSTIRALKYKWQAKIIEAIEEANADNPLVESESQQTSD